MEDELALRRAEIVDLQGRLSSPSSGSPRPSEDGEAKPPGSHLDTLLLREQLLTASREHHKESSELREKFEAALEAGRQEADRLRATVEKQSQEISELKQRVQQATKENMEMMDSWKVRQVSQKKRLKK